jgi:hypothetical protein
MTPVNALEKVADGLDESIQVAGSPQGINAAEVDLQIATANKYRRSIRQFKESALEMATLDVETAASCMYTLPRGGKPITGPSVRLAEICASAYKNLRVDARVIGEDGNNIVAEAACWDLENNVAIRIQNRRRLTYKNGKRFDDDMITVTGNAATSIALRNAIFRVIPKAFINDIYLAARRVAIGDAKTLSETRANVIDYFGKMGVLPERICQTLGRAGVEDIGLDDIAVLKGLATAIRDNQTTVDEAFPLMTAAEAREKSGMEGLKDRLTKEPESNSPTEGAVGVSTPPDVVAAPESLIEEQKTETAGESPVAEEPAKQDPAMSKKRADLLAALDESDQERLAIMLEGRELSTLTDGQLKDLYRDLSK